VSVGLLEFLETRSLTLHTGMRDG